MRLLEAGNFIRSGADVFVWIFRNVFFVEHRQTSATELNCVILVFSIISKMWEHTSI